MIWVHEATPKGAATYSMYPAQAEIYGETYRFLVLYSDKLDGRKKKAIDAKLANEVKRWQKDAEKLEKQDFACEADATEALNKFTQDHHGSHTLPGQVVAQEQKGKRKRHGRPKKDEEPPPTITVYRINIQIDAPTDKEMKRLRERASTFILITNVMEENELSDIDMLKSYKGQQVVENRFRFLKSPYFVGRVFLEKPKRVEAFATVMMLSVMVYSLFEYLIRKNMEQEQEPLDLLGDSRKSFRPTGESVLEILDDVMILRMEQNGKIHRFYASNNRPQVTRIMKLLEMNMAIYTNPPDRNSVENSSQ